MKFTVITLFPDWVQSMCQASIVGRALEQGLITLNTVNPRDFTSDPHHKVDDTPYGGGGGMVMQCGPLMAAYESLLPLSESARVILMSPWGEPFKQPTAKSLATASEVVFICGHYEGVDARILNLIPNLELLSLGDFVLTGGELAAACVIDATSRLLPGVLGNETSHQEESFEANRLEYPHYTKPRVFRSMSVPEVLLSGNHQAIKQWRAEQSFMLTTQYRPDLLSLHSIEE